MKRLEAVWKPVEETGIEHLRLKQDEQKILVISHVLRMDDDGKHYALEYRISCDTDYTVRVVKVMIISQKVLYLTSDGQGNWFNAHGQVQTELKGCIDVDITATPFTNTLPIKRINWKPGQSETLKMVYFLIPEMTFHADEQRYTCLEQRADGATFRFEQLATGFTADLQVDADGLVLDYPGLFERVKPS